MDNPETNDQSVLLMFDPLTSPPKSDISRETPRRRKELDPTSPVAAFFSSVDKSKNLLATVRKQKQADLIDLGQVHSPLGAIHEHVEQATGEATASVMATPLPTFKVTTVDAKVPPMDPFSPATYATTSSIQFLPPVHHLNLRRDPTERNNLIFLETPAKTDLLVSTNFTPVPANLPSLLNASLSSLRHSGTDSVTSTARRRRSSIDLDQELQAKSPDSSFDILRGELEIGNSADVSFISALSTSAAGDSSRATGTVVDDDVGESPWTIRTTAPSSGYHMGSGLLPVEEVRETSLLAHEIPLPESCPTSPESSTGHNEDANMHASKVFSHLRRFSMANPSNAALQFPTEERSPRSPSKRTLYNTNTSRKSVVHARTTSMSSISSISSNRSGVTLKGSPSKRVEATQGTPKSPSKMAKIAAPTPTSPSKTGTGGFGSAKRLPRPSIATKPQTSTASTTAAKPRMSVMPAPRISLAPARKVVGTTAPRASIVARPRASMMPPGTTTTSPMANTAGAVKRAPRASVQPTPRPSVSRIGPTLKQPLRAPRTSMAPSTSSPNINADNAVRNAAALSTTTVVTKPAMSVLAPSVRANSTAASRTSRPSLIGALGGALTKKTSVSTALNTGKLVAVKETEPAKTLARHRPRTSSAGAALISRPELEMELERDRERAIGIPRPVSVAARLVRPKSSMRV